jgi:hypothetical protein
VSRRVAVVGLLVVTAIAIAVFAVPRLVGRTSTAAKPGTIVLNITGRFPATMTLPAVANWCPVSRVAEIEAVSVDTGFAIALHEKDSVTKGPHPVFAPNPTMPAPTPSAMAAFRWLRMTEKDTGVVAYRSTGGHVDIDENGTTLSGSLLLYLRVPTGNDSVTVTGRFAGLKVIAMAAGCT